MGYYSDYFRAEVRQVVALTPNMIRIVFGGPDLSRFASSGDPDERLVVVLPRPGERAAPAPVRQPDGTLDYPTTDEPEMRSYTVRRVDAATGELVIDFVRHEGGAAATWAVAARVGDVVYLSPAKGWYSPPDDVSWQLLMADMTALPALGRILEELPGGQRAVVLAEVTEPTDRQEIESVADVATTWLPGSGNGHGPSRLLAALQSIDLPRRPRLPLVRRRGRGVPGGPQVRPSRAGLAHGALHRPGLLAGGQGALDGPLRRGRRESGEGLRERRRVRVVRG